jgi:hypothetical protein
LQKGDKDTPAEQHGEWYSTFAEHPAEWTIAAFTIMLAVYTRGLYKATAGLQTATVALVNFAAEQAGDMKASIKAAEAAAKAAAKSADISEDAFRRLERPYLLVVITDTRMLWSSGSYSQPSLDYTLANYGKLPAILRSVSIGLLNNPEHPLRSPMAIAETQYEVIKPGSHLLKDRTVVVRDALAGQKFNGMNATLLILYGIIQYEDPTGAFHTDSFCMRGMPGGISFTIDGGDEHNWHDTDYPPPRRDVRRDDEPVPNAEPPAA